MTDNLGRQRFDAALAVSDTTLASLAPYNPIVTALAYGQLNVIATVDGVSAQAQMNCT